MDGKYLGISRIRVEHITKKLARNGYARDDKTVDVVRVDHERFAGDLGGQLGHSIKIDEEGEENFVGGWAVFVDA